MPSPRHKRAPSIDMTAIGLRNANPPTPTYSSIFRGQDRSFGLHQMYETEEETAPKRSCFSNASYPPEKTTIPLEADEKAGGGAGVEPSRTTAVFSSSFNWPSLPQRTHPTKHKYSKRWHSIPWILALASCITLLWLVSVSLGAGLFSAVLRDPTTAAAPVVQKIYVVLDNGEAHEVDAGETGTVHVTVPVEAGPSLLVSTEATPTPTPTTPSGTGTGTATIAAAAPQRNTEAFQNETSTTSDAVRRDAKPTGFATLARRT